MSQDNVLKKEFNKRDVTRVRNVMSGKASERTIDGVGYRKTKQFHEEGDIWTEDGRQWTIKDGIKQNITKLDKAKEAVTPYFCPKCSKVMKDHLDGPIFKFFKHCFNCHAEFEMRLKHKGLWDDYQKQIDNAAVDRLIEFVNVSYDEALSESNKGWVSEAGEVQKWRGGINKELAQKSLDETIEYLESLKK